MNSDTADVYQGAAVFGALRKPQDNSFGGPWLRALNKVNVVRSVYQAIFQHGTADLYRGHKLLVFTLHIFLLVMLLFVL